ncbi:MAG: hypothetical protein AB7H96_09640 [Vicinamibacterales bacterium]
MPTLRMLQAWMGTALLAGTCAGCTPPDTDIMATSSEGTGPWDLTNVQVNGGTLTADVCVARDEAVDTVSDRVLRQLRNKGYERFELTMYAGAEGTSAQARRVSWSPTEGKRSGDASAATSSPCAASDEANPPGGDHP